MCIFAYMVGASKDEVYKSWLSYLIYMIKNMQMIKGRLGLMQEWLVGNLKGHEDVIGRESWVEVN